MYKYTESKTKAAIPWQLFANQKRCFSKISIKYICNLQVFPLNGVEAQKFFTFTLWAGHVTSVRNGNAASEMDASWMAVQPSVTVFTDWRRGSVDSWRPQLSLFRLEGPLVFVSSPAGFDMQINGGNGFNFCGAPRTRRIRSLYAECETDVDTRIPKSPSPARWMWMCPSC